ncbi:hypothetical protein VFC49_09260 [Thermococcus sp. SY098]|uniref:hypothetical protein n=1 Tax=Thermococcus sp. SY098 TaxID=3111325 RepID=UPI002D76BB63|nr:hypothetical protein [Thermococcus sp. SY098]WRS52234.1 hypothetical protein VFC49_09260 [Thermococcus sp. SY098]
MMVAKAYDFDPLPKPRKRPGRPPKWKQGIKGKYYKMPIDLEAKLKRLVQEGKFESEVEAIYHYVMYADKLDELFERIKRLETQLELKEKENEALRARIKVLESENEELKQWKAKALELEKKLEDLQVEKVDLWTLARKYLELKERKLKVWSERELMEIEREQRRITEEINVILEDLGVDKLSFWKTVNQKGLDEAKKLFGE